MLIDQKEMELQALKLLAKQLKKWWRDARSEEEEIFMNNLDESMGNK